LIGIADIFCLPELIAMSLKHPQAPLCSSFMLKELEKVKIELFDRVQPDEDGNDINVMQVMIYQEGLPDSYLEFKGDEDIVSRIRPVTGCLSRSSVNAFAMVSRRSCLEATTSIVPVSDE
jgi:hypothetical protein